MVVKEIFSAPSPKDGATKTWEAISELGTANPILFETTALEDNEEYRPEDEGYDVLLSYYKKAYPNS